MSDILYRPDLTPKKDYHSDGAIVQQVQGQTTTPSTTQEYNRDIESLVNSLVAVKKILPMLPLDINRAIKIPLLGLEHVIGSINLNDYKDERPVGPNTGEVIPVAVPVSEETEEDDDAIFSDTITDLYDFKIFSDFDYISKQYAYDIVTIANDYLKNIEDIFNKYLVTLALIAEEVDLVDMSYLTKAYNGDTTAIKNKNLLHLSDTVIRNQIVRGQKIRLYKKLFDIDQTIAHIRAIKIAKELRARYDVEEYRDNVNSLAIASNTILSDVRMAYDKKYRENLFNLYKYLNSSVILINECLVLFLQEAQAKSILIKEEGIKL